MIGHVSVPEVPEFHGLSLERRWENNEPGQSCVPAGFYYLEPHDGTKYKETFALIGEHVSHSKEAGVPRFACVFHKAKTGLQLEGCTSFGTVVEVQAGSMPFATMEPNLVDGVLDMLRARPAGEKHYLTIWDPPGLATR